MNPRLLAISGPLKGSEFYLHQGEYTVGREPSNAIWLERQSVSRRHCVIRVRGGRCSLLDLESLNATFVNRVPVKERELEDGDEVRIGEYSFLFLTKEATPLPAPAIDESERLTSSVVLRSSDSPYLTAAKLANELEQPASARTARIARDLHSLLAASRAIHALRDTEAIASQLLQSAFELAPAYRGTIVLFAADEMSPGAVFARDRQGEASGAAPNYQALIDQVKEERATVLREDSGAAGAALIGAPLMAFERMFGVVVLQSNGSAGRFNENHLQLIAALGEMAGPAFDNARRLEAVESENRRLQSEIGIQHNMVGESGPMRAVFQMIGKSAPADVTVLIRGESGTGKELVARAIHAGSRRTEKPFVAINCASLSETLMESELFGHERGAFTGAIAQKRGKIELANGGTVFLDEIGEMAPALQARLLRFLQEREFERVGGSRAIRADIRLIAATNRDLERAVESGLFRRDLYYRLNVVSILAPPLRERREDIPLLASYFAAKYAENMGRSLMGISEAARAALVRYDWPGNVRELENAMERAIVLGSSGLVEAEDLPESVLETVWGNDPPPGGYHKAVMEAKKTLIVDAIERAGGSHAAAAKALGINPTYLSRLIRNLNLKSATERA